MDSAGIKLAQSNAVQWLTLYISLVMRLAMNKATILQFQIKASLPDFVSQLWSKVWKSGTESLGSRLTEFCSGDLHDYVIYSSIDYILFDSIYTSSMSP